MLAVDGDMPKDGSESVGVACQYCGQLGKRANCQAAVFVAYLGRGSAALVDRRLYLSQAWVSGESQAARRQRTGVPEDTLFRTKPQLALDMLTDLVVEGSLPVLWVTCDEGFSISHTVEEGVAVLDYMAEVPVDTWLWPARPPTIVARTRPRLAPGVPASLNARVLAAQWPADAWTRHRIPEDCRGSEYADFALRWVVASAAACRAPRSG